MGCEIQINSRPRELNFTKFGGGTQPDDDATDYPQYEELSSRLRTMDEELLIWLESTNEKALDQGYRRDESCKVR